MTQEEKNKLLKYLCEALPYGVIVDRLGRPRKLIGIYPFKEYCFILDNGDYMPQPYTIEDVKPYLRPMSSMTEEEYDEITKMGLEHQLKCIEIEPPESFALGMKYQQEEQEWMLKKHLDFMGLIPMDCAIEVTEDNNPYKD